MTVISDTVTVGISLASGGNLVVTTTGVVSGTPYGVYANSSTVNNAGYVYGGNIDVVTTGGNMIVGGTGVIAINASAVTNTGSINANGEGVFIAASSLTNSDSGTISGGYSGVGALNGSTVTNFGSIIGHGFSTRDFNGIYANASKVINYGYIYGGTDGVVAAVNSTVSNSNSGTISSGSGSGIYANGSTVTNSGSIDGIVGVNAVGSTVTNIGNISGTHFAVNTEKNSTLNVLAGATFDGDVADDGTGLLNLAGPAAGTLDMGGSFTGFENISFGIAAWTLEGTTSELANGETISGFTLGDTIALVGFTASSETYVSGFGLQLGNGATEIAIGLTGSFIGNPFSYSDTSYGTALFEVLCFLAGTRITTAKGAVAVEDLRIGDTLPTLHGGKQQVKWIGTRQYLAPFTRNPKVVPVCIKAGAIADGVPARDLFVSPGHAICIDGVLVHASRLVNGVSVVQAERVYSITYYHIEMETHEIIFAENCPAETFMGEDFRRQFQNAAEYAKLYPGEAATETMCLPRLDSGFQLHAIQQRIAARAGIVTPTAPDPGPLRGYVDQAGPKVCSGWVQDISTPEEPVCLDVTVDGRTVGRVLANLYRDDVREAGYGSGYHGFEFLFPPGIAGRIDAVRAADRAVLAWSETAAAQAA